MSLPIPWRNGHRVCLLSTSPVKKKALEKWLAARGLRNEIVCVEPTDTRCPQPADERSAMACLSIRLSGHQERGVIYVAVENYVEHIIGSVWVDLVAVGFAYSDPAKLFVSHIFFATGQFPNFVPVAYAPKDPVDSTPKGFMTTVGSRIHADNELIPANDWAQAVNPLNISRMWQIFDALWACQLQINIRPKK